MGLSELEDRLLDSFPMQRLARVKQLGHTYIVYPSAVHTRIEHSLGALYIAGRMCDQLGIPEKDKEAVRAAVLLHDVGHGPFSHVYEEAMKFVNGEDFSHERVSQLIIAKDQSIHGILGSLGKDALELLSSHNTLSSEIVSSSLDADKLDYLRRDSYHTGVFYGVFDLERILRNVCKVKEHEREYLAVDEKAKDALESYRLARYSMHAQVYEHHTRLITDDMFTRAVVSCIKDGTISKEYFDAKSPDFLKHHLEFDDSSIEQLILERGGKIGRELIARIRARKLFKRAYVVPLTKEGIPNALRREELKSLGREAIATEEKHIADRAELPEDQIIVHLQSTKIKLYERFEITREGSERNILLRRKDRPPAYLDEESPIYASTNPIRTLYVFCPEDHVNKVREVSEKVFEAPSFPF